LPSDNFSIERKWRILFLPYWQQADLAATSANWDCFMPKKITQYRVFIGSPGGLAEERQRFRAVLEKFSLNHGSDRDAEYKAVGWEDTVGGVGRPQELISEDLKQCDYAVFVLHDRWGSPTGSGYSSGTEEEWSLAEELYRQNKIRNIALFFKSVHSSKLGDPGDQLKPVIAFKTKIECEKSAIYLSSITRWMNSRTR
jgi:hypothetical protein